MRCLRGRRGLLAIDQGVVEELKADVSLFPLLLYCRECIVDTMVPFRHSTKGDLLYRTVSSPSIIKFI